MPLNLPALADLEWLLRPDAAAAGGDGPDLRGLGQRLLAEAGVDPTRARRQIDERRDLRRRLALSWLDVMRQRRGGLPGEWIGRGLRVTGWILVVAGFLLGCGAARALLAYAPPDPINVLPFVSAFFLVQILLLVVLFVFVLGARMPGRGPGILHQPIAWLARRLGGKGREVAAVMHALRARHGLYVDVERWTLFTLAQGFGVAFNVGGLLTVLAMVAFTDLKFCWSTTLSLEPGTAHAVVRGLSLPWSWLPAAVPSLEVVTASQWERLPGAFVHGTSDARAYALAAEWWAFLAMGALTYGLLPRLLALVVGQALRRRALASVGFDHAGFQELFDRLLPRGSGWSSPAPGEVLGAPPAAGAAPAAERVPEAPGAPLALVLWGSLARHREAVLTAATRRFAATPRVVVTAGGASLAADAAAVAEVRRANAPRIALAIAAGHQPTGDVHEFLRRLRTAVARGTSIITALLDVGSDGACVDADSGEREAWRRSLSELDDPHLWVDAMDAAS